MDKNHPQNSQFSYETGIKRLEAITKELDNPQTSIADAIKLFEEGQNLVEKCQKELKSAQSKAQDLKVKIIQNKTDFEKLKQ